MKKRVFHACLLAMGALTTQAAVLLTEDFSFTGTLTDRPEWTTLNTHLLPIQSDGSKVTLIEGNGQNGQDVQRSFSPPRGAGDTTYSEV